MFRNREIRFWTALSVAAALCSGAFCFKIDWRAGVAAVTGMAFLFFLFFWFTRARYRDIRALSDYLFSIRRGGALLDVRDNREGELSILKNDLYKVALTLYEQAELLQKDKRYLADSLADISHQLKTPLTSLNVMTDLLAEPTYPDGKGLSNEKRGEFIAAIHTQLERIEWLVSALLKLSKIDAGAVTFHKDRLSAAELIQRAYTPLAVLMDVRGQTLDLELEPSVFLTGDLNWLSEALANILKNCSEHTPEGGTIRITCRENPIHIALTIEDNGCGISKEDLPRIFERFYRGENASPESVGIGLSMAKAILTQHNAQIYTESEIGKGTKFMIRFAKQIV